MIIIIIITTTTIIIIILITIIVIISITSTGRVDSILPHREHCIFCTFEKPASVAILVRSQLEYHNSIGTLGIAPSCHRNIRFKVQQ